MIAPAIVITTPADKRLARCAWKDAGFEQSYPLDIEPGSKPIYRVVPKNATDEAIAQLVKRFEVAREQLVAKQNEPWNEGDSRNEDLVALYESAA